MVTFNIATWQFVVFSLGIITTSIALVTPWVRYHAGLVADAKDEPMREDIKKNSVQIERVEQRVDDMGSLATEQYNDLKADFRDMRADIRSIREILAAGKRA